MHFHNIVIWKVICIFIIILCGKKYAVSESTDCLEPKWSFVALRMCMHFSSEVFQQ